MVTHPGAARSPGRLRPLNRPRPLTVDEDEEGRPIAVHLSGRRLPVESLLESWRIDDEWWRQRPVSRVYYRLLLEDGRTVTVYKDRGGYRWYRQTYLPTE